MANKYAYNKETNEAKTARAMAKSLKISPKHCVEICNAIRGMEVTKAKNYLEDVIDMKKSVPFKRHNRQVGHRKGQEGPQSESSHAQYRGQGAGADPRQNEAQFS